jgi:CxxC-x17-CxxC domain-containing protein
MAKEVPPTVSTTSNNSNEEGWSTVETHELDGAASSEQVAIPAAQGAPEESLAAPDPSGETPVEGTDQKLACVDCGEEFLFTAADQAYFKQRNFTSPPRRCKSCRSARRRNRRRRGRSGRTREYRSPAFREERRRKGAYRSPAFQNRQKTDGVYRSPAFREQSEDVSDIYRSPAFQDQEPDEEIYRGPAFRPGDDEGTDQPEIAAAPQETGEHDLEQGPPPDYREPTSPQEMYRSPAFADTDPTMYNRGYKRRTMHEILCAKCGKKSKVPFKPQKSRAVFCKECYATKR